MKWAQLNGNMHKVQKQSNLYYLNNTNYYYYSINTNVIIIMKSEEIK
jgi:hypothetical protein